MVDDSYTRDWTALLFVDPYNDFLSDGGKLWRLVEGVAKVYAVIDASGDPSEVVSRTTLAHFTQAGVVPISTNAVICEIYRTWNRPEAAELAKLYSIVAPNYAAVIESYQKAQDIIRAQEKK